MSDTDNKTENATDTKAADIAPYMKKTEPGKNHNAQAKTEMLIPAVLLLVSVIVIGATFYNKQHKDLLAETNTSVITATEVETSIETPVIEVTTMQEQPASNTETKTEESSVQIETDKQDTVAQTRTPSIIAEPAVLVTEKAAVTTTPQTLPLARNAPTSPTYTRYQYQQPYNRKQAQARAKQHMEMLQQRRQAYEREMQDRRARYETAMKARQEKQVKVNKAKKAVFQRIQKDRLAADQKIQEIHQQIAKLHEEIHQIMRDSKRNTAPVQMHSM